MRLLVVFLSYQIYHEVVSKELTNGGGGGGGRVHWEVTVNERYKYGVNYSSPEICKRLTSSNVTCGNCLLGPGDHQYIR
jgi:hypothetical protein